MEKKIVLPTPIPPPRALLPLVGWATWGDPAEILTDSRAPLFISYYH